MTQAADREYRLALRRTVTCGAAVRVLLLLLLLTLGRTLAEPYLMADDGAYEALAVRYLSLAERPIDPNALHLVGADAYLEPLWPCTVCLLAGLTGVAWASRLLNVLLSSLSVWVVAALAHEATGKSTIGLRTARLMAYLPLSVCTALFPIKDIYLLLTVFATLLLLVQLGNGKRVRMSAWLCCIALTVGALYVRGAVVPFLAAFALCFALRRCRRTGRWLTALFLLLGGGLIAYLARDLILGELTAKLDAYGEYAYLDSNVSRLQMRSPGEIWKLPAAYLWATLQPIRLPLLSPSGATLWWDVLSLLNLSILPVAVANALYTVLKKEQPLLFWCGFALYASVITLSLGVFRHYLFLFPLEVLNAAICMERTRRQGGGILLLGSAAILLALALYSMR